MCGKATNPSIYTILLYVLQILHAKKKNTLNFGTVNLTKKYICKDFQLFEFPLKLWPLDEAEIMEYQIDIEYLDLKIALDWLNLLTLYQKTNGKKFFFITLDNIDSPTSTETNVSVSYDHDFGHQITMSMRLMSKYLP